ncbi:Xanthine dehydrogenase, molybdenum binding subunit (EC [uncultured Gammaproteobacteria bacterium]|nr:Xanthine dehydrogenase, molybdenum binding subunit (EC [uncultured Gammaproteobacteria bacterium]
MNPISLSPNFARILLLSTALIVSISTAIAGGRSGERNLMDDYLQSKTSVNSSASSAFSQQSTLINNNALVFNRGATSVDNDDFDKKFSLAKTLTNIRNTSNATTNSSNAQLLNSLLKTLNVDSKTNGFVKMDLQKRAQEASLSGLVDNMSPTAIFNRFDLSSSSGQHCGEYRVIYHKNNGGRFFLIFEAQYPNPELKKGKAGCFAVADFWKEIGSMSKTDALVQLEKFFYQGLEHKGVQLPAAINFAHYTHGTGQVRSNAFINSPWQLREFKTDINTKGEAVFVADSVKSNPLAELFAKEGSLDSDSLKDLRVDFIRDFSGYVDNLLAPEKRATNPSSSDIINGFGLENDNQYNEFQSDSSASDNTANAKNTNLKTIINNKLAALNLSGYNAKMIMNRAEAMSCGGCHQNSNGAEIAPNVKWPPSKFFVHVDERGNLSPALTKQFLPARAALLADYWQKTVDKTVEKWRFAEVDFSSAYNDFGGLHNALNYPNIYAFAALKADGSITAWGDSKYGGSGAPDGNGYTKIYSNEYAFAALKADGSITAWGDSRYGGSGAPYGNDYTKIYSTEFAFAALKADGSITAWGASDWGGTGAPSDNGYTKIYSTGFAFAALKADGSITAWGSDWGGSGAPDGNGYTKIYSNNAAFAIVKADGSITAWGSSEYGGSGAPSDNGYTKIYSNRFAFAALKADGSITAWGDSKYGGTGAPSDNGYTKIYSTAFAFAALKADGSITAWGDSKYGGTGAPSDNGYTKIYSTLGGFAAVKADGSITAWGDSGTGGTGAPDGNGYTKIYSTWEGFAAVKADGSITAWGGLGSAPDGNGYTKIYSNGMNFVAVKADGSLTEWGWDYGGTTPTSNATSD